MLKSKFGDSPISRIRILTRLGDIDKEVKEVYNKAYDLRVQADYGRTANILPLNKENIRDILSRVKDILTKAEDIEKTDNCSTFLSVFSNG